MAENVCRVVCEADLKSDLMSSFSQVDLTQVVDRTCNNEMFLSDDPGLKDVTDAASGPWLEAGSPRSRIITSMADVRLHYAPSSEVYKYAAQHFQNAEVRGVTSFFFVGWWNIAGGEAAATALDLIAACQPCWLHVVTAHYTTAGVQLMDDVRMLQISEWAQINERMAWFDSIAPENEDPSDPTTLKAQMNALGLESSVVHYTAGQCGPVLDSSGQPMFFATGDPVVDAMGDPVDDPANPGTQLVSDGTEPMLAMTYAYHSGLQAGWVANVDLSQLESAYTLAYKPQGGQGWIGVATDTFDNGVVTAVTGVLPDGTTNNTNNGYANVYVQTAGYNVVFEGKTVTGAYVDQVHLSLYLKRRLQDALAALAVESRKIPYDNARGRARLAIRIASEMSAAQNAGHFTNDVQAWEQGGSYIRKGTGWVIRQASFAAQSAARKNQRKAPAMQVCYIPAGGVHHTPITLCTLSVPSSNV